MRGQFRFFPGTPQEIVIPNNVVDEGEESFLKMIFQDDHADVAGGGNFYVGLCNQLPDDTDVIADITTEPTSTGGYARQALARNATDWPTISLVNGNYRAQSVIATFTASGADFDKAIKRAFLCNVLSGSVGVLFAYSGPLPSAKTILDGESFQVQYEFFLR